MTNKELIQKLTDELLLEVDAELEKEMPAPFAALTPAFDRRSKKIIKGIIKELIGVL